jgi:hypothetical protein
MKQFLEMSKFPLAVDQRISVKVWQDYDALDQLMARMGYESIEPFQDERIDGNGLRVGMQNRSLHSGWIATMGDSYHVVGDMIRLLNRKVRRVKDRGVGLLVGFCQTGHFSVGYTIYVKGERNEWN